MRPCPMIVALRAPDAPHLGWIAILLRGETLASRYPISFTGSSQDEAEYAAEAWWMAEQQRLANEEARAEKRATDRRLDAERRAAENRAAAAERAATKATP